MAIQGLRNTSDYIAQYQDRPENWRAGVLLLDPNGKAPLFALTSMLRNSKSTDDPHFHWFEEETPTYRIALTTTINDSATTFACTGGGAQALKAGDILYSEQTAEQVIVAADPTSDTSFTVTRGFAGTTAAAITVGGAGVNPNFLLIGSTYAEGSSAPTGRTYNPTGQYNYTQIFRDTFSITRTQNKTNMRTGDTRKEDQRRCLLRHSIGIERAMIFGVRSEAEVDGVPRRTMNGIISQIPSTQIIAAAGAAKTMEDLEGWLQTIFAYGSEEKLAFVGNTALTALNRIVRRNSSFQIQSGIKEYGMNVARFVCPHGILVLKSHPLFSYIPGGTAGGSAYYGMDSWVLTLDMAKLQYRYVDDTTFQPDLQANDTDGKIAGYLTECGIQVMFGKCFHLIKGLTDGTVDS